MREGGNAETLLQSVRLTCWLPISSLVMHGLVTSWHNAFLKLSLVSLL